VLFIEYRTVYDLATAVLWTSAFCLLRDGKHKAYLFVFVLACLNRIDTAPFLALLHFAYFRDWKWAMVQGAIFVSVFGGLRWVFFENVGLEAWVMPISNVQKYLASWQTMFWLSALIVSLCFVFRGWASKPLFLRYAFVILFPIFVALHIVFGQPFEFRVFWEVYPLIVSLMVL
jgi:hypothetical protein